MALIRKIKDGETTIYPITADQAVFVGEDGTTLDEALNNKADKATSDGGFAGGNGASATLGGAVGNRASATLGGAIGDYASESDGGFAGGSEAFASSGGAVGSGARTSTGFAGGSQAKTVSSTNTPINAIQLGTGTNSNAKTLQIYNYQLMDANGNIPAERLKKANIYSSTPVQVGAWIDGTPVWRVAIPMTSVSEIGLDTYNKIWTTSAYNILSRLSIVNDTSNLIYINSMIYFQNTDDYDPEAFAVHWTEPFPGYFRGEAVDSDYATHFYGWIEFVAPSNNIGTV